MKKDDTSQPATRGDLKKLEDRLIKRMNASDARATASDKQLTKIEKKFDGLESRTIGLEQKVEVLQKDVKDLHRQMAIFHHDTQKKFMEIDGRFDTAEEKLDDLSTRFGLAVELIRGDIRDMKDTKDLEGRLEVHTGLIAA